MDAPEKRNKDCPETRTRKESGSEVSHGALTLQHLHGSSNSKVLPADDGALQTNDRLMQMALAGWTRRAVDADDARCYTRWCSANGDLPVVLADDIHLFAGFSAQRREPDDGKALAAWRRCFVRSLTAARQQGVQAVQGVGAAV
jgi:hypothetical protein